MATEQDLHAKIRSLDEEVDTKRDLLGMLMKRHDDAAAELAGADANLSSAGADCALPSVLLLLMIMWRKQPRLLCW